MTQETFETTKENVKNILSGDDLSFFCILKDEQSKLQSLIARRSLEKPGPGFTFPPKDFYDDMLDIFFHWFHEHHGEINDWKIQVVSIKDDNVIMDSTYMDLDVSKIRDKL